MSRIVYVTRAQVLAAQGLIRRSLVTGRPASSAVVKIANARKGRRT